jgi:FkbM family methyltransferase
LPRYCSQYGEDAILWQLFGENRTNGFFVEVGALDGRRLSNTYSFELAGWRGVCVEAHRAYHELLRGNRPRSVCVHAAVGERDAEVVPFYANRRGSLSTLDATMEGEFRRRFGAYFTGFEVQQVAMRRLDTILSEAGAPAPIDLVSIDVEGRELAVLRGFDLGRYRPRALVIEAAFDGEADEMDAYMQAAGYVNARVLHANRLYCRERTDAAVVATASADVAFERFEHPLDSGELADASCET